jgi:hypothetical protein
VSCTIKISENYKLKIVLLCDFNQVTLLFQFSLITFYFSYQMVFGIMSSQQQHEMVIYPSSVLHSFLLVLSILSLIKTAIFVGLRKVLKYFILFVYISLVQTPLPQHIRVLRRDLGIRCSKDQISEN